MLEYEWGNPSTIILNGGEPTQVSDQNRQIFDHYTQTFNESLIHSNGFSPQRHHFDQPYIHIHETQPTIFQTTFPTLYDPRSSYAVPYTSPPPPMLSLQPVEEGTTAGQSGYIEVPKSEPSCGVDFTARIGLNLGGRTYFSSAEDDFVNRLYHRSRPAGPSSANSPRCQAEGCNADLTHSKHYHRRHKVCEFHSKAATVIAAGLTQRFCQQCSRFHLLSEFDNGKRSCRKRLADHNRRRRKSQQPYQERAKSQLENACNSSSENLTRSSPESGVHSSSSVTVAISPPRMSVDCFHQRSYQGTGGSSSSASPSLFFFSNG